MARYFLHQRGGRHEIPDEEGHEAVDLDAARARAIAGIRSILAEELLAGYLALGERIDIHDARNRLLASIDFPDAFQVRPAADERLRHP